MNPRMLTLGVVFILSALSLCNILGCGKTGPKTHSITGKVEVQDGPLERLAGSHVEAVLTGNPNIRASGVIRSDGTFQLETLHSGVILKGAQEGSYQARLILIDEDPALRQAAQSVVDARFLQFDTSGFHFEVPSSEEIVLRVSSR